MKQVFHHYTKWECCKNGFYDDTCKYSKKEAMQMYCDFLSNPKLFEKYLNKVINEWKYSCEQFLTNKSINKIAWLGQASMCMAKGMPAKFRSGFYLMSKVEQKIANNLAYRYYLKWKRKYSNTLRNGKSKGIQVVYLIEYPLY